MIDGGLSVLYDAIVLLPAETAMEALLRESAARDLADAFTHCKFIGYVELALPLFAKCGIGADDFDDGCISLGSVKDAKSFVDRLGRLRIWDREPNVKMHSKNQR